MYDNYAIREASAFGFIQVVNLLLDLPLERGVDASEEYQYADIEMASESGYIDVVKRLLSLSSQGKGGEPSWRV